MKRIKVDISKGTKHEYEIEGKGIRSKKDDPEKLRRRFKKERRRGYYEAFGSLADQLDYIYHHGLDAWKRKVAQVKANVPKPDDI